MSKTDLAKQKILHQQRKQLLESGVDRKAIKLRGDHLLLNNQAHGYVDSDCVYHIFPELESDIEID